MRLPLRWQLTAWYATSLVVLLLIFCGLIDALMHERLLARTDFELDEELHELVLEINLAQDREELARQLALRFGEHKTFEFLILAEDGERIFQSRRLGGATVPDPAEFSSDGIHSASAQLSEMGDTRIAAQRIATPLGPMTVRVLMPLGLYLAELRDLRWLMLAVGPLMALVSLVGGYWLARRSLAPVDRMTQAAARITAQQLDERLDVVNPHDELGRLATTFNGLLDRLEKSFAELRNFTADAAHEFRTPLAVMRTTLEVALHSPRSATYYENCLQELVEEIERLTSLSNQLLLLAREDAGLSDDAAEPIDLGTLVEGVSNDLEPLAQEKSLVVDCQTPAEIVVAGERQPLRRVFLNLLQNALNASPVGGEIQLRLAVDDHRATVTILDSGPGIAAEHLPHIFERFYRIDPSRSRETGGTGLGLAICRAVIVRHGGSIHITSRLAQGTVVSVMLPTGREL